jgi:hypothetical protein
MARGSLWISQLNKEIEMTTTDFHFFAASVVTWASTNDKRDLRAQSPPTPEEWVAQAMSAYITSTYSGNSRLI